MPRFMIAFVLLWTSLWAQQPTPTPTPNPGVENEKKQEPATELGKFKLNCPKHIVGCAEVLFTGQPLHIAVGSIAPQNGFGAGLAYVGHKDGDDWSKAWSADAVGSSNGSWRAGFYLKFVGTHLERSDVSMGVPKDVGDVQAYVERPVYNFYAQSTSLNKLTFFGEGPATTTTGRSFFGMTEHIVGASTVWPFFAKLNAGIFAELNGRLPDIRPSTGQGSPSIETLYTPATAPGLAHQPFFLQPGVGVRMRPATKNNLLHLNYAAMYQPFIDTDGSGFSFQRLTFDLYQEISIHHTNMYVARDANSPNDCRQDATSDDSTCPRAATTTSQVGTLGLRVFNSLSMTPGTNVVPFYFQPTLGGSDINGSPSLSSYQDYRFRAPNVLLLQESFDHSIGHWPLGITLRADQGKVALLRGDLGSNPWRHSYAAGFNLRAGGFPMVYLLFAFGGHEGTHTIVNVNTSLLGSSARPSLF